MSISKLIQTDKFRTWLNKINEIIDSINTLSTKVVDIAPLNHASTSTEYGKGSSSNYGHVKLSDSTSSTANISSGVAATPLAVKTVYDLVNNVKNDVNNISNTFLTDIMQDVNELLSEKAPLNHASTSTEYGKGSSSNYGHVKLSDSTSSTDNISSGVAATPLAVKTVYDLVNTTSLQIKNMAPLNHASASIEYGIGDIENYGHVKVVDDLTKEYTGNGITASVNVIKNIQETSNIAKINSDTAIEKLQNTAPQNHASTSTEYGIGDIENYGHVKVVDDLDTEYDITDGVVASLKSIKQLYTLVLKNEQSITNLNDIVDTIHNSGYENIKDISGVSLNSIIDGGKYFSTYGEISYNYPYTSSTINILDVITENKTGIIVQILYSEIGIYIRKSYNNGTTWNYWNLISGKQSTTTSKEIYLSREYGNDENDGTDQFYPIQTYERLFDILNTISASAFLVKNTPDVILYLDRGTYTDFPVLSNIPVIMTISSFYYEDADNISENYPGDLEENKPHINALNIYNSNVTLINIKVDDLIANDSSIVTISLKEYISINHIESKTNSIVYTGSIHDNESLPLLIHNNPNKTTSLFCAKRNGIICDVTGNLILHIKEDVNFTYLFECELYGGIYLPTINFTLENESIKISSNQYYIDTGSQLYYPETLSYGTSSGNISNINCIINGSLYGNGNSKYYLSGDGKYYTIKQEKFKILSGDYTITNNDDNTIFISNNSYTINLPETLNGFVFHFKNISTENELTIHPYNCYIDENTEDLTLKNFEFITLTQYESKKYIITQDNRIKDNNLMYLTLEDPVVLPKN